MDLIQSLDEYQAEAFKTMKDMGSQMEATKYCCLKLAEEVGEVNDIVVKHAYHGKPFNRDALRGEAGDCLWAIAVMAKVNGFSLSDIATANRDKLRKRHGDKYNAEFYQK